MNASTTLVFQAAFAAALSATAYAQASATSAAGATPPGPAASPMMTMHKISPSLYMVEGAGGNVVVYTTDEGVILVDDKNNGDANTDQLLALVRTVSDKPVKYVFISHYHADHVGGNQRFLEMGAQVISTENTAAYMSGPVWKSTQVFDLDGKFLREQPYNAASAEGKWQPIAPPIVFSHEIRITLGGKEVRARYFGPAHTGGDAFIFFPAERAVAVGDNLRPFCSICVDYHAGGSLLHYIQVMDGLLGLNGQKIEDLDDFETVIPGHGSLSNKAGLKEHRDKLVQMRDTVIELKHAGKSYGEIARFMMAEYKWEPEDRNLGQWTFPGMMKELQ